MALGRGLGQILSEVEEAYEKDLSGLNNYDLESRGARIAQLNVDEISPNPYQPRKHFDETALKELSESIKEHGLLQPIVVIEKEDGYILIAGERRLRAHKLAKIDTVKSIIAEADISDIRLRELALIENIQRENLNAIELANSYAELIDIHKITHDELSSVVHKSRSQITNTMRLLSLSAYAQEQLIAGKITQGHAKVLVGLDAKKEEVIINTIIGQKLSVRDAENIVKNYKQSKDEKIIIEKKISFLAMHKTNILNSIPFETKVKSNSIEITFTDEIELEKLLTYFR